MEIKPDLTSRFQVSRIALGKILRKRTGEAGVKDCDWRDLRRTTASNLLDAGADVAAVFRVVFTNTK